MDSADRPTDEADLTGPAGSTADPPPPAESRSGGATTLVADGACPFLVAASGAWRMSVPDRDHRCAAFTPATSLAPSKQARLCLTASHVGCATYIASMSARERRLGSSVKAERAGRWALARTTPVVEEVGGLGATLRALIADRRTWPAIPAVLLATLALALGLSGSWGDRPVTAIASPTFGSRHTPPPASLPPVPSAPVGPSVAPTAVPSVVPSAQASATPAVAYTTYTVKSGDNLSTIAGHFGTTVKAIQQLNNLSGTRLVVGQVLKIPTS